MTDPTTDRIRRRMGSLPRPGQNVWADRYEVDVAYLLAELEELRRKHETAAASTTEALERALQAAWNDFCDDTGCVPDCFTIHGPRTTRIEADFKRGNFVRFVADWLTAGGNMIDVLP